MRRQRNLHLLPSCSHVHVSHFSSLVTTIKSSPSNHHSTHRKTRQRHAGPSSPSPLPINASPTPSYRTFQTHATTKWPTGEFQGFNEPSTKHDGTSFSRASGLGHAGQSGKKGSPPWRREQNVRPFLIRRGEKVHKDIRERAVQLTPWRGTPTVLHALAFIRELEEKYGRIWWAGLSKEKANPYEYNPMIIVIFEDAASLSRIPGFTLPTPMEPPPQPSSNTTTAKTTLRGDFFDLGPSPSLNPLESPHSQDLLKNVEAQVARNRNTAPLFVPWSERMNIAAYRQGGPSLEDILPLLRPSKAQEKPVHTQSQGKGDGVQEAVEGAGAVVANQPERVASPTKKASWEEFDEPVNIDAVVRQYAGDLLYLPSPANNVAVAQKVNPYFRPHIRLAVAHAMIDFGGFSKTPVPSMEKAVEAWQKEVELRRSQAWTPSADSVDTTVDERHEGGDSGSVVQEPDEELRWDDLPPGVWPIVNPGQADAATLEGGELVPKKQSYQRIAADDESEGEGSDLEEWEGTASHPLQFPRSAEAVAIQNQGISGVSPPIDLATTVRSRLSSLPEELDRLPQTSSSTSALTELPILSQLENLTKAASAKQQDSRPAHNSRRRDSEGLQDPWRTDPRPFRSGLGGDDPSPLYTPTRCDSASGRAQWSKPGMDGESPGTRERGAMALGRHSPKSEGWGKDRRGKKLRSRDEVEMLNEFGLGNIDEMAAERMEKLRAARARGEFGRRESWTVRETARDESEGAGAKGGLEENAARISAIAGKERRKKEVKNLKERLRAILDGTNV